MADRERAQTGAAEGAESAGSADAATVVERPSAPAPAPSLTPTRSDRPGPNVPRRSAGDPTADPRGVAAAPLAESAFDPPDDRFTELDELGRGGMGRVVEAYDRALDRAVAVKYMLATDETDLARFDREARITARLEHPGIVAVHDAGRTADGTPYYVMRRIAGEPLSTVVERSSPLARRALVPSMLAAADAVAYAHARGVIHRDLKPSNILIGEFGETLVIDWGLARAIAGDAETRTVEPSDPSLTRAGTVAGTPGFMSPEQARGEALDARVDVYALGATLFYVLTGELAYRAKGATELIGLAGAARPPNWSRLPADTPTDLRAILTKAMSGTLAERYADAGALAADLRRFVSGQLVGAHDYGWLEQLWRFIRRHRAAVTVAVAAVAVIVVGALVSVRRVVAERDAASAARLQAETARRTTEDQKDLLLVRHAQRVAHDDPVEAIMTLRRLPATSRHWPKAVSAAGGAASRGVPSGLALPPRMTYAIEYAPGSRRLALIPFRGRELVVVELPGLTTRRFAVDRPVLRGLWLDDQRLVISSTAELTLLDLERREQRSLELGEVSMLAADGTTGVWVLDAARALRRVDVASWTLGPAVVAKVDDLLRLEPGRNVVVHDGAVELWEGGKIWPITKVAGRTDAVVYGRGHLVVSRGGEFCVWRLAPTPEFARCLAAQPDEAIAAASPDTLIVNVHGSARMISTAGTRVVMTTVWISPSLHGNLGITGDRDLTVNDGAFFRLSARGRQLDRISQSPDRRFVAATSSLGELMVWDLDPIRPEVFRTAGETMVGLTHDSIFVLDVGRLVRVDRATGVHTNIANVFADGILAGNVDPTGSWFIGHLPRSRVLYHVATRTRVTAAEMMSVYKGRPFVVVDGRVSWVAPDGTRTEFGHIPDATAVALSDHHILAMVGNRQVCRQRRGQARYECTEPAGRGAYRNGAIDDDGTAWLLFEGELWRWREGEAATAVAPGVSFLSLIAIDGKVGAATANAWFDLSRDPPTATEIPPVSDLYPGSDGRLFGVSSDGEVLVIDTTTGDAYPLVIPRVPGRRFDVDGDTVAVRAKDAIWLARPPVPVAVAELQAWVATATNAISIDGTSASSWPALPDEPPITLARPR